MTKAAGAVMRTEIGEAPARYRAMLARDLSGLDIAPLHRARAIYTIARGSSDAAANILSYAFMRLLGKPMTTLPPSVFSLGAGVDMAGAAGLVISQSGSSSDLVRAIEGVRARGGHSLAITNTAGSPVSKVADICLDMGAGPELAIPATKSVICTLAAGMALLGRMLPDYLESCTAAAQAMARVEGKTLPALPALVAALKGADSVFVIGRGCGYGTAQEIALKFKECAALHAEAYSASEVLHGPVQLATRPLTVLILNTLEPEIQDSLNLAEARFRAVNTRVFRVSPADLGVEEAHPASAAALLLYALYPVVHGLTLARGLDPDTPATLAKITDTL
jgi:glucosamine--fructose-6-phosphate aminotransferase (isomerizing)